MDLLGSAGRRASPKNPEGRHALRHLLRAAFTGKQYLEPLANADIPTYEAFRISIAQIDIANMPEANRRRLIAFMKMREIAERS